jgi:predicted nucleic acid-binding protein
MTRTFVDAGVLLAAATGRDPDVQPAAAQILDDPQRTFVSSVFVRLELLPKAIYHRRHDEAAVYDAFFARKVVAWAEPLDRVVQEAFAEAARSGLAAMDALHVAAAALLGADELVTTERPERSLFRVTAIKIRSIHPGAASMS